MPYYGDSDPTPSAPLTDASPTITQMQDSAQSVYPTDSGTPVGNTLGMAALAPLDLVDTVASNKYLQPITEINRGDVNDAALSAAGMPGITDFYNQHRQGIENEWNRWYGCCGRSHRQPCDWPVDGDTQPQFRTPNESLHWIKSTLLRWVRFGVPTSRWLPGVALGKKRMPARLQLMPCDSTQRLASSSLSLGKRSTGPARFSRPRELARLWESETLL